LSTCCVREEECPRCGRLLRVPRSRGVTGAAPIQRALALVREQLRVDVTFVSEIVDGREVVRHAGDGSLRTSTSTRMYLFVLSSRKRRPDLEAADVEFVRSVAASLCGHLAGPADG